MDHPRRGENLVAKVGGEGRLGDKVHVAAQELLELAFQPDEINSKRLLSPSNSTMRSMSESVRSSPRAAEPKSCGTRTSCF
jgi:hypothetical protein